MIPLLVAFTQCVATSEHLGATMEIGNYIVLSLTHVIFMFVLTNFALI